MRKLILAAALAVAVAAPGVAHAHPASGAQPITGCSKRYTVQMETRAARVIWGHTHWPSIGELHYLGRLVHCQRNPQARWYVRWYNRHQRQLHNARAAARAAAASVTPYGVWAIPAAIVMCESHGQNLPPNGAGASGYYQIIPSTWASYGGKAFAPEAYLSSKYGQDVIASRIWDHGNGAGQWVCKA